MALRRVLAFADPRQREALQRMGLRPAGGALLYGPPGTYLACAQTIVASLEFLKILYILSVDSRKLEKPTNRRHCSLVRPATHQSLRR